MCVCVCVCVGGASISIGNSISSSGMAVPTSSSARASAHSAPKTGQTADCVAATAGAGRAPSPSPSSTISSLKVPSASSVMPTVQAAASSSLGIDDSQSGTWILVPVRAGTCSRRYLGTVLKGRLSPVKLALAGVRGPRCACRAQPPKCDCRAEPARLLEAAVAPPPGLSRSARV